ncbi:hypothetical protein D3C87_1463820 [compost metagenome]
MEAIASTLSALPSSLSRARKLRAIPLDISASQTITAATTPLTMYGVSLRVSISPGAAGVWFSQSGSSAIASDRNKSEPAFKRSADCSK